MQVLKTKISFSDARQSMNRYGELLAFVLMPVIDYGVR